MAFLYVVAIVGSILALAGFGTVAWSYWDEWQTEKIRAMPTPIPNITLTQKLRHLYPETRNMKGTKHA